MGSPRQYIVVWQEKGHPHNPKWFALKEATRRQEALDNFVATLTSPHTVDVLMVGEAPAIGRMAPAYDASWYEPKTGQWVVP